MAPPVNNKYVGQKPNIRCEKVSAILQYRSVSKKCSFPWTNFWKHNTNVRRSSHKLVQKEGKKRRTFAARSSSRKQADVCDYIAVRYMPWSKASMKRDLSWCQQLLQLETPTLRYGRILTGIAGLRQNVWKVRSFSDSTKNWKGEKLGNGLWSTFGIVLQDQSLGLLPSKYVSSKMAVCASFLVNRIFQV